ncbi:MAG: hypothetical protein CK551_04215 [Planctomycetaceae bacterium]|nr:MAG: hypothetical protein CK551_04215 [Planctomycetaceae bacterium]
MATINQLPWISATTFIKCLQAHPHIAGWAFFFSITFSFALFPPTPNPLINDLKPTHCSGWVYLFLSF